MFPNMVEETPYDLRWRMFGVPVRVHPLFWLMAAILSWHFLDLGIPHFLLSVACIFLSILVHELGHVLVGRAFGSHGHIVLWAFGGVAIGSNQLGERWKRVLVLLAGPGAQFLLFGVVWVLGSLFLSPGRADDMALTALGSRDRIGAALLLVENSLVFAVLWTLFFVNLIWPVLNLLPILPLDGGQITREFFTWLSPRNGVRLALHVSVGLCVLLALHALLAWKTGNGIPYLVHYVNHPSQAIFFGLFALMGIQSLQMEYAHRRSFDPWDYHERW
jgi:Zn-dependent protease